MRNLHLLDAYRVTVPSLVEAFGGSGDHTCGAFVIPSCIDRGALRVIASTWEDWEHVSCSRKNRCPNWIEMSQVHRTFFADEEACMQLHVPVKEHINCHPYTLHIWRPTKLELPRPPAIQV